LLGSVIFEGFKGLANMTAASGFVVAGVLMIKGAYPDFETARTNVHIYCPEDKVDNNYEFYH
jgi:hypothetical protein